MSRAARWLPVLWPLLVALWASVAVLLGVGHGDWVVAAFASIGVIGGLAGAWFGYLLSRP